MLIHRISHNRRSSAKGGTRQLIMILMTRGIPKKEGVFGHKIKILKQEDKNLTSIPL